MVPAPRRPLRSFPFPQPVPRARSLRPGPRTSQSPSGPLLGSPLRSLSPPSVPLRPCPARAFVPLIGTGRPLPFSPCPCTFRYLRLVPVVPTATPLRARSLPIAMYLSAPLRPPLFRSTVFPAFPRRHRQSLSRHPPRGPFSSPRTPTNSPIPGSSPFLPCGLRAPLDVPAPVPFSVPRTPKNVPHPRVHFLPPVRTPGVLDVPAPAPFSGRRTPTNAPPSPGPFRSRRAHFGRLRRPRAWLLPAFRRSLPVPRRAGSGLPPRRSFRPNRRPLFVPAFRYARPAALYRCVLRSFRALVRPRPCCWRQPAAAVRCAFASPPCALRPRAGWPPSRGASCVLPSVPRRARDRPSAPPATSSARGSRPSASGRAAVRHAGACCRTPAPPLRAAPATRRGARSVPGCPRAGSCRGTTGRAPG